MVGFLWIISNINEVIRENKQLSKGIGDEENSHK